jgi:DNA-binding CsgD family transcriptional regulator
MASSLAACAGEAPAESLVETIYATIGDDGRWQAVLRRLCEDFSSRCAALARYDFSSNTGEILHQAPANAPLTAVYAYRGAVNPWFLSRQHYAQGRVITGLDIIGRDEFLRTDFYREVLRPNGLFHRLCGVLSRASDQMLYVVLHRRKEQEEFGEAERQRLAALLPHLAQAVAVSGRLHAAERWARLLSCVVDTVSPRLFIIDAAGRIAYSNVAASDALEHRAGNGAQSSARKPYGMAPAPGITLMERLGIAEMRDQAALVALLRMAMAAPGDEQTGTHDDSTHQLRVHSSRERAWMLLSLRKLRMPDETPGASVSPLFAVTVSNPQEDEAEALHSFARHFSLSPAQSRVSALILKGHSPLSVASALHLSANTVRSHLKQIFLKTNTHRQAELITLLKQFS